MNKEYTYIKGKAIVRDENRTQKPIEYYDNLDEVLVKENLIENMENTISYLEKESQHYKKYNKCYFPFILPLSVLTSMIGIPIMTSWLEGDIPHVNTIFGTIDGAILCSSVTCCLLIPFAIVVELGMYRDHKNYIKKGKGINNELEFLKKQLVIEKENLDKLKKDKTRDKENKEFRVVKVDDLKILKELKSLLNLYYDLGYNDEKYYKYYLQEKLNGKLGKYYNNNEIEIAKKYLEEKGPTLVKSKNLNK